MANSSIKNLNIDGNVVISGSTTSIDVATVTVDDKHIELNAIISPDDSNASGGGIIIKGTTDKVFSWINLTNSWTSDRDFNITGTDYKIDNVSVINATTLGSSVVNSALTSVGTLGSLQVNDVIIAKPATDNLIGLSANTDLIKLESGTVTIDGGLVALTLEGEGSSITGISTANVDSPGTDGQILYSDGAIGWGGHTSVPLTAGGTGGTDAATARTNLGVTATGADATYATVANNLSDLANAATARTNIGVTATGADTTYATVANNLGDLANATTARTNLGLGSTNNPTFGGEGLGVITITATPSNSGTVAPTFGGTVFKNIPVTALSGHKWVTGIEQDGEFCINCFISGK